MKKIACLLAASAFLLSCKKNELQVLDPKSDSSVALSTIANSWDLKTQGAPSLHLFTASFSIGELGYIATGSNINGLLKDLWEYNPSNNAWTRKADFAGVARSEAFSFVTGNKAYVGGGIGSGGPPSIDLKDFWEYDSITGSWIRKADYPGKGVMGAAAFSMQNIG